ncbi:YeeE/YedE thiosulfate transporter family protein [Anderseniella sp. Alg231-50]|uniref:YeeE/YedE thiosulfate transporter family protein n=1 Tax=Anderseniella sp. Alg231-50 TaxID=1922226 RepID=UPI000D54E021
MIEQLDLLREEYGTATLVVWGAFAIGVLFGIIAEFSRYCARAALAEWAPGSERSKAAANSHPRSKQYLAAVLVALVGTQALFVSQNIDLAQSIYWSVPIRPVALVAGGLLFGAGMVLAGGCVSRLLVLAASGNGRSIVTLLVTGIAGYATLRGILSYPRIWLESAWSLEAAPAQVYETGAVSSLSVAAGIAVVLVVLLALLVRKSGLKGVVTGALVGLVVVAGWAVTGIVGADDFDPTQLASLSFVAPAGETIQYLMIFTGDTIRFSVALLGGVLAGALVSALAGRRFSLTGFTAENSLARYLAGGLLMGFGGVTALGCSIGQGLSGISTASLSSVIAVLAIAAGGYGMMRLRASRTEDVVASGFQAAE